MLNFHATHRSNWKTLQSIPMSHVLEHRELVKSKLSEIFFQSHNLTTKKHQEIIWLMRKVYQFFFSFQYHILLSFALLRSLEGILFTSFLQSRGFSISRGYWSWMPDYVRIWPPSWTDWHTWPWSHDGIDPMPDKMNLDYLKLLYCGCQKYEVMTLSVVGGLPKRHSNLS